MSYNGITSDFQSDDEGSIPFACFYRKIFMSQNQEENDKNKFNKKHFFKIDVDGFSDLNKMLKDMLFGSYGDADYSDYINSFSSYIYDMYNQPTDLHNYGVIFIGKNSYNEQVFKPDHFVEDKLHQSYLNHIRANAVYFLQEPKYYNGLYEILN